MNFILLLICNKLFYYFLMKTNLKDYNISSDELYSIMKQRRSSRFFKPDSIPLEEIKNCIKIAGSAPSGANMQPWSLYW